MFDIRQRYQAFVVYFNLTFVALLLGIFIQTRTHLLSHAFICSFSVYVFIQSFVFFCDFLGGLVENKQIFTAQYHHLGWCMTRRGRHLTGPSSELLPDWRGRLMRVWKDTSIPL